MTGSEVFSLMRLRSEVFVVEQKCVYLDMDDKDAQSVHLFACEEGAAEGVSARAVVRLVPPGLSYKEPSIGRVAIGMESRGSGLGEELMLRAIRVCYRRWPGHGVRISAQQYLIGFYQRLGFETDGGGYLEDDIPHIQMYLPWAGLSHWHVLHGNVIESFADSLRALPKDLLKGTAAEWGGMQVLEHLRLSEKHTWSYLEKKCQVDPAELKGCDLNSDARGLWLVRELESDVRWIDPTPGGLLSPPPGKSVDVEGAIIDWKNAIVRGYERLDKLYDAEDWWRVLVFKHPIAGRIGLFDTLAFGVAHIRHHMHQLKRIADSDVF